MASIGSLVGASCAFFVSKYVIREFVKEKILENQTKYPWLSNIETIDEVFKDKWQGIKMVALIRLVMLPFAFMCYVLAITSLGYFQYLIGSLTYLIKVSLYTFVGAIIWEISIRKTNNGKDLNNLIFAGEIFVTIVLTILISLYAGSIFDKKIKDKRRQQSEANIEL